MASYQSGEFSPPNLSQLGAPPAVGIYNDTLIIFGGTYYLVGGFPKMIQTTLNLTELVWGSTTPPKNAEPLNTEALLDVSGTNSPWSSSDMILIDGTNKIVPFTRARCGAASLPSGVYGFWNYFIGGPMGGAWESSSGMRAAVYTGSWGPPLTLLEQDGKTEPIPYLLLDGDLDNTTVKATADVSATAFANKIIVAIAQATSATNPTGGIYLGVYDPGTITTANTWAADWSTYIPMSQLALYQEPWQNGNIGSNISIDWFSLCPATGQPLQYFLAISFAPQLSGSDPVNGAMIYQVINVTPTGPDTVSLSIQVLPAPDRVNIYHSSDPVKGTGTVFVSPIVRDPCGRIRAYALNNEGWAGYLTTTYPAYPGDPLPWAPTIDNYTANIGFAPGSFFYVFDAGSPTDFPVYEFIFYNNCQVNRCGTIQLVPNASPFTLTAETPTTVITGIIDGPIPLPLANYPATGTQTDGGNINYGNKTSTNQTRDLTNTVTLGFQDNGQTTKGIGPAWNASFSHGLGQATGTTEGSCISYPLQQEGNVTYDTGSPVVNPLGTIRTVSTEVNITGYRYLDENGAAVSDATSSDPGQASKVFTILASFADDSILNFVPYTVTPGDLTSYTATAWDTKMGANYYSDVICANAYPLQSAANPYVELTWTSNAVSSFSFSSFDSAYTESMWSIQGSVYVGVSGGGGFELFGNGDEISATLLAGVSVNQQSTTTDNTSNEWGISLSESWGPPNSSAANAVQRYVFRLFFLPVPPGPTPPSNCWTSELIAHIPNGILNGQTIDPNSSAWRIVYVVTEIDYNSGETYRHDATLDRPSKYSIKGEKPNED